MTTSCSSRTAVKIHIEVGELIVLADICYNSSSVVSYPLLDESSSADRRREWYRIMFFCFHRVLRTSRSRHSSWLSCRKLTSGSFDKSQANTTAADLPCPALQWTYTRFPKRLCSLMKFTAFSRSSTVGWKWSVVGRRKWRIPSLLYDFVGPEYSSQRLITPRTLDNTPKTSEWNQWKVSIN